MATKKTFSIFENMRGIKGAYQTTPTNTLTFSELINYFNSKENIKLSNEILNAPTPGDKLVLKNKRAYYTPYGKFSYRENVSILEKNNVVSIDIDGLENREQAISIRNKLAKHKSTLFALLSPRGKGVKAMMLINPIEATQNHIQLKHIFKPYLKDFLNIDADKIDESQFKLSQPCYFSFDADMYVNEDAEILDLKFDYKEEERKPFVPFDVPNGANNKIEKYIFKVLQSKIDLLTPHGARHPKLFNIVALGQIIQYAPHLEHQILETFISAGERMYSEKAKIRGVKKNVLDAWSFAIQNPINNPTLDSIVLENKPVKVYKNDSKKIDITLTTKYIGQDKKAVKTITKTIQNNKKIILNASTGLGKNELVKILSTILKEDIICTVPTISIADQQADKYGVVKGGISPIDILALEEEKLIYSTYSSLHKLQNIKDKILVIDESHLLSDRSNILESEQLAIMKTINVAKKVVFLSATTNPLLSKVFDGVFLNVMKRKEDEKATKINTVFYNSKVTKRLDALRELISNKSFDINYLFIMNKKVIEDIRLDLIKLGIYKEDEIAVFTANICDVEHDNYKRLMEEQIVDKKIKCILSTSKISEGVNIKNEQSVNYVFFDKGLNLLAQSYRRFRLSDNVKITVLFEEKFKQKKGIYKNDKEQYLELVRQIKNETLDFTEFKEQIKEDEKLFISPDFLTRSTFFIKGQKYINPFEVMHEVKAIKEHFMDYSIWKKEISNIIKDVVFVEAGAIEVGEDKNLKVERKQRKEERKYLLLSVYHMLVNNPNEMLDYLRQDTKNDNLKGFINKRLRGAEIEYLFYENERILFFKNVSKIESYVNNIIKLSNVLDISFDKSASICYENDCFKNEEFKRLYDFKVWERLEKDGVKTRNQKRFLHKIEKIKKEFNGVKEISSNDMFTILKNKFYYKLTNRNKAVVNQFISVVFNVSYDRKTKIYTLERRTKKRSSLIGIEKKFVPSNTLPINTLTP